MIRNWYHKHGRYNTSRTRNAAIKIGTCQGRESNNIPKDEESYQSSFQHFGGSSVQKRESVIETSCHSLLLFNTFETSQRDHV